MDPNISRFETKIFGYIRNGQLSEAIEILTQKIICGQSGDAKYGQHYHLLRSYCYFKTGSAVGHQMALKDILSAIDLDENRYQPYLLGALILSAMKQWDRSLKMFEKTFEIKDDLFETFVHKLFYIKFKIMTERGFDEELSFNCALSHRYLDQCLLNAWSESDPTDSHILQLIGDHKNECSASDSVQQNNFNTRRTSKNTYDKSMVEYVEQLNLPIDDLFASGDQNTEQTIGYETNQFKERLFTKSPQYEAIAEDYKQMEPQFNELSLNGPKDKTKYDSIEEWIQNHFIADSVSKMCSFGDQTKPELKTEQLFNTSNTGRTASISVSDIASTYLDFQSSVGTDDRNLATNLLKLRAVYIGNIRNKCCEKELKDMFGKYGTIVDFYQPFQLNYAFIHYKTHDSALQMLTEWKGKRFHLCPKNKKLIIRLTPSEEQMQKYNSMSLEDYKKRCNSGHECHLWRLGKRCPKGADCPFKHVSINRAIDSVPEKRKSKWKSS